MDITVKLGVGPDLSMVKHERTLTNVWRRYPYLFTSIEIIEPDRGTTVLGRPEPETLLDKMQSIRRQINRLQYDINGKGHNVDLESMTIAAEGHIETLKKYEELK